MNIFIDKKYNWKYLERDDLECWYIGSDKAINRILSYTENHNPKFKIKHLKKHLDGFRGNFAFIVQNGAKILAAVDKIRSYPIFYLREGDGFAVSNSARTLKEKKGLSEITDLSLLEFRMAGYVTGRETLLKNLYQLQAGEFLVWDKTYERLERERYYIFYSEEIREEKETDLVEELADITNRLFYRMIREIDGSPIWIALSGGLDSRLVLCMLKELKYDDITAFSYGSKGNYEAKAAEEVARRVGVPWHFVSIGIKEAKKYFYSSGRKNYWKYSDGLCSIPNMQDILVLWKLKKEGKIPDDVVIINGQSGDFITGGHIPELFIQRKPRIDLLIEWAVDKHYSQWHDMTTKSNLSRIRRKILDLLEYKTEEKLNLQQLASLYEWWEWQERQCKYVVNGQRIYDYFGIKWFLPLWDDDYLKFWEKISVKLKYRQKLYRLYLEYYDFFRLFKNFKPEIWRWPGITIGIVPIARMIRLLFGKKCSDLLYHYASYIGHYRMHYAPYRYSEYIRKASKIRGAISLDIETWLKEYPINIESLKKGA